MGRTSKVKPTQSQIESKYGIPHEKIDEGVDQIDPLLRHELETRLNEVTLATRRETTESKRAFIAAINLQKDLQGETGSSRISVRSPHDLYYETELSGV